jgi:O-antigen/teichoic acid export membrane protein
MRIDQILIRDTLGARDLGIYAAALPISNVWQVIPVTLATSFAPYIARMKAESEAAYLQALYRLFRLFSGVSLVCCFLTVLGSFFIVNVLYGAHYQAAVAVLCIHVFSNVFISLGVVQSIWLVNEKKGALGLIKTASGVLVCISCNLLLLPRIGLLGAAISTVLAQGVSAVLTNVFFAKGILKMQLMSLFQIKWKEV